MREALNDLSVLHLINVSADFLNVTAEILLQLLSLLRNYICDLILNDDAHILINFALQLCTHFIQTGIDFVVSINELGFNIGYAVLKIRLLLFRLLR